MNVNNYLSIERGYNSPRAYALRQALIHQKNESQVT